MSRRDVELVIKAQDQASKTANTVADSLRALEAAQKRAADSAGDTGNLFARLGSSLEQLQAKATALTGLGKVANNLREAERAVGRLEEAARGTADDQARLARENRRVGETLQQLRDKSQAANSELNRRRSAIDRAVKDNERYAKSIKVVQDRLKERQELNLRSGGRVDLDTSRLEGLLAKLREVQTQAQQRIVNNESAFPGIEGKIKEYTAAIEVAEQSQTKLNAQIDRGGTVLAEQRQRLTEAQQAQKGLNAEAARLSTALGGVEANQDRVKQSAAGVATAIDSITQALQRQRVAAQQAGQLRTTQEAAQPVEVRATAEFARQRAETEQLRQAFIAARAEAGKLSEALARAASPTAELQAQMVSSRAAAVQAGVAYRQAAERSGQLAEALGRANVVARQTAQAQRIAGQQAFYVATTAARAQAAVTKLTAAYLRAGSAADRVNFSFRRVGNGSRQALSLFQRFRGEILSVTAAAVGLYQAFDQFGLVVSAFRTLEAAQSRLGAVFDQDFDRVGRELRFLEGQAARLGIGFDVLSQEYSKFVVAANSSNFALDTTRELFLSVAEAGRVNKLSVEQLEGIFLALTQMISKGTVTSEELRRQLGDRLPGAFVIFAKALEISTAELGEMMQAGEVLANEETLIRFARQLNREFGGQLPESLKSSTTQFERLRNTLFQSRLLVAESGFLDSLTESVIRLNEALSSDGGRQFFQSLGSFLGNAIDSFSYLVQLIAEFNEFAIAAAAIFAGRALTGRLSTFLNGLPRMFTVLRTGVADLNRMEVALRRVGISLRLNTLLVTTFGRALGGRLIRAVGTVTVAIRGLIATLGGLPGILGSLVVFGVIEYFLNVESASDRMRRALDSVEGIVQRVTDAFADSTTEAEAFAKVQERITKTELDTALRQAETALREARRAVQPPGLDFPTSFEDLQFGLGNSLQQEFNNLFDEFKRGIRTADELRLAIDEFFSEIEGVNTEPLAEVFERIKEAESAEEAIELVRASLAALEGNMSDAQRALLPLSEDVDDLGANFAGAATDIEAFDKAMRELGKYVPELADEMRVLQELAKIDELEAAALAQTGNNFRSRRAVFNRAAAARAAIQDSGEGEALASIANSLDITVDQLSALIGQEGGIRTKAYQLPGEDFFTIGIGDTGRAYSGRRPQAGTEITRAQALDDFRANLEGFEREIADLVTVPLTRAMKAALLSVQFNTGGLGSATGRALIVDPLNEGRFFDAAQGIRRFRRTPNGFDLGQRRDEESSLFLSEGLPDRQLEVQAAREFGERLKAQRALLADLAEEELQRAFETSIAGLSDRDRTVETAVFNLQRRAAEEQLELQDGVLDRLREQVGAQYDAVEAARQRKEQEEGVAQLYEDFQSQQGQRAFELSLIGLDEIEQQVLRAQREYTQEAERLGTPVSEGVLFSIRRDIEQAAKLTEEYERQTELAERQAQYFRDVEKSQRDAAFETRIATLDPREQEIERAIYEDREARALAGLELDERREAAIRRQDGALYDVVNAERLREQEVSKIEENIRLLEERRGLLLQQIEFERDQGNTQSEEELKDILEQNNEQLREAIDKAIAFYETLDGPESQNAIMALRVLRNSIGATGEQATLTGEQVAQTFASTMTSAISSFFQRMHEGMDTIKNLGQAFREFAANFLNRIGEMIVQAVLLRAVMAGLNAIGLGGVVLPGVFHEGGIVGRASSRRQVDPMVFAGAMRFHTGGLPGLRRDEVPIIAQKGEEVLARNDPRNALNGGASGGNVKVVNAVDGTDVLDAALSSSEGERVLLNKIRSNRQKYRSALGVS